MFWSGILLMISGALLRWHCVKMLGSLFNPAVIVKHDQQIVERGAYRWLRHPSYLGAIILFVGMGLALTNWFSLAIIALALCVVYGYRISIEEQALVQTLGAPYSRYMSRTKRLIPFIL
jgi:protein-S-isoprenylcysteine O-methyltransferase Ste14